MRKDETVFDNDILMVIPNLSSLWILFYVENNCERGKMEDITCENDLKKLAEPNTKSYISMLQNRLGNSGKIPQFLTKGSKGT